MNTQALTKSAIVSTILQVLMVVGARYIPALGNMQNLFPVAGTAIGGIGGLLYGMLAKGGATPQNAGGGAAAGAIGGVLGSALSGVLGGGIDPATLGIATGSTGVAGAIGGILGKMLGNRS